MSFFSAFIAVLFYNSFIFSSADHIVGCKHFDETLTYLNTLSYGGKANITFGFTDTGTGGDVRPYISTTSVVGDQFETHLSGGFLTRMAFMPYGIFGNSNIPLDRDTLNTAVHDWIAFSKQDQLNNNVTIAQLLNMDANDVIQNVKGCAEIFHHDEIVMTKDVYLTTTEFSLYNDPSVIFCMFDNSSSAMEKYASSSGGNQRLAEGFTLAFMVCGCEINMNSVELDCQVESVVNLNIGLNTNESYISSSYRIIDTVKLEDTTTNMYIFIAVPILVLTIVLFLVFGRFHKTSIRKFMYSRIMKV